MDREAEAVVLVSGLSVAYRPEGGQPVQVLDNAALAIGVGERLGILGESGSGKSTLAATIMRLLPGDARDRGSIRFRGHDMLALSETALCRIRGAEISLIPQDPAQALNPVISVGEQIAEVLRAHVRMTARDRRARVDELLDEVGFDKPQDIYTAYPHELSGGQRQRIVIAQAVACRPTLVIADEPTSKLDASLQTEILALMRAISQRHRMAFVVISHDPTVLAGIADRIAVMYAGRVVEEGSTQDIFRRPLHPYTQALVRLSARHLLSMSFPSRLPLIADESPGQTSLGKGCRFAARCPERRQACTESDPQETVPAPSHRVSCFKYDE